MVLYQESYVFAIQRGGQWTKLIFTHAIQDEDHESGSNKNYNSKGLKVVDGLEEMRELSSD